MKNFIIATCVLFLIATVASCNKAAVQTNALLISKWNIVNDSLSVVTLNGTNYIGTPNDYYNFMANGSLYINENSLLSAATYSIIAGNQIDISYDLPNNVADHRTYYITNLTEHTLTLTLSGASLGPAGRQIINLEK